MYYNIQKFGLQQGLNSFHLFSDFPGKSKREKKNYIKTFFDLQQETLIFTS